MSHDIDDRAEAASAFVVAILPFLHVVVELGSDLYGGGFRHSLYQRRAGGGKKIV